jgi:hypothetical protein
MSQFEFVVITEGSLTVHEGDDIPEGYDGPIVPTENTEDNEETS